MRIPLLFNASIKHVKETPRVPINAGNWRVVGENIIDSKLSVHYGPLSGYMSSIKLDGKPVEVKMKKPGAIFVRIDRVGSERAVSVYAESI